MFYYYLDGLEKKGPFTKNEILEFELSNNTLILKEFNWEPSISLETGLEKTYKWIYDQIKNSSTLGYD